MNAVQWPQLRFAANQCLSVWMIWPREQRTQKTEIYALTEHIIDVRHEGIKSIGNHSLTTVPRV
jgi:hypothetical protein